MSELNEIILFQNLDRNFYQIHSELESSRPKGMLYHYTKCESLESILKSRELFATNYKCLKDGKEIRYGQKKIKHILLDLGINEEHIIIFQGMIPKVFDNSNVYITCFAPYVDKAYLWENYASNGMGYAIGFNENFQRICDSNESPAGKAVIAKIHYGHDEAMEILNKFITEYNNFIDDLDGIERNSFGFIKNLNFILARHLVSLIPVFKRKWFDKECEVRKFYVDGELMGSRFSDDVRKILPNGNEVIFPEQFLISDISEIWVGPNCDFEKEKTKINRLLDKLDYKSAKIEIKQAKLR